MTEAIAPVSRKKRTGVVEGKPKQKRHRKSGAAAEIDKQLAEALKERTVVGKKLAEAAGHNARYQQLSAEINELLNMQARMNGVVPAHLVPSLSNVAPAPSFQVGGSIPVGVGSIPPRQAVVTPSAGNVAEKIAGEGDFA